MDAVDHVVDALGQVGLKGRAVALTPTGSGRADKAFDVLVDLGDARLRLQIEQRALVTDDVAARLLREVEPGSVLLVVADRVTHAAGRLLSDNGAGYLDLRGRLVLRSGQAIINALVDPVRERRARVDGLSGAAGLEVAVALLTHPRRTTGVRRLASELGRSASTVSEVLSALRSEDLVDGEGRVVDDRLFWRLADRWSTKRTYLASLPNPGPPSKPLRLGLDHADNMEGWALTDTTAAAIYGAPVAVRSGQMLDFYVPDASVIRRATTLLGVATPSDARAAVRVGQVPAVCRHRVDDIKSLSVPDNHWPLAQPLFVALDLAQDAGRGREILQGWDPGPRWERVW